MQTRCAVSLSTRLERTFFSQRRPPHHAGFTLADGRSRVYVILHRRGAAVHMVALCTAGARRVVSEALVEIQSHFRARGLQLRASRIQEMLR
ncbi:MAG: hypothetical protein JO233_07345 [Candidatus Eremiobacteraeota bacterium]|nr:hypothetical protein [Candidatus Eremiobacteraeota bacterium]